MAQCIIGWAHLPFGRSTATLEEMVADVAVKAIADAGIEPRDVDAIFIGTMNGGFVAQEFPASLALQPHPDLRFTPATRVENACASGSAAIYQGLDRIAAGRARFVLAIGVEKMTGLSSKDAGEVLIKASYVEEEGGIRGGFAGIFGVITERYFERYGDQSDALAMIAAKNHRNGAENPLAHVRRDLGFEFCRTISDGNPLVAGPLRRTDCSMISDGAAAVVLTDEATARSARRAIRFRSAVHVNDFLPMSRRDITAFEGPAEAWARALAGAAIALDDLGFVELHDCFTSAELIAYEAMGLVRRGEGARAVKEGWTDAGGPLPVNPSGGLKAKGHPIGATGVSMHVLSCMQLMGQASGIQIDNPKLAGIFNMGGTAVASYVSILERCH